MKPNIYIRDFEMPENCHECPFAKWEYSWCTCIITKMTRGSFGLTSFKRPRSCPLVYEKRGEKEK